MYETALVPPGGFEPVGIAWMDTHLLSARLYSGSQSPGGGPFLYTAPVEPAQALSLVAAFNGGFLMATGGGYFTEGRVVVPLVAGAASLVIYANGTVDVGAWGSDVSMAPDVVAVRQNLTPLVEEGRPTMQAASADWLSWGNTCGATSCAHSVPGVEQQWRSGVGVTADGALVYATGPSLTPLQLAQLLVRADVVRGMELDINPNWPFLVTYSPADPGGLATPANGTNLVATTVQGPATPFDPLLGEGLRHPVRPDGLRWLSRPVAGQTDSSLATSAAGSSGAPRVPPSTGNAGRSVVVMKAAPPSGDPRPRPGDPTVQLWPGRMRIGGPARTPGTGNAAAGTSGPVPGVRSPGGRRRAHRPARGPRNMRPSDAYVRSGTQGLARVSRSIN